MLSCLYPLCCSPTFWASGCIALANPWILKLSLPGKPVGNKDLHYQMDPVTFEHFLRETLIAIKSEVLPAAR